MYLSISARFTLKNVPKGYQGLRGISATFGRDKKIDLSTMCIVILKEIINWYFLIDGGETLNEQIKRLIEWLETLKIQDVETIQEEDKVQKELF